MAAQAPTFTPTTELPNAGPKTGAEKIEMVQGGTSVQMTASDLVKVDRYDLLISATSGAVDAAACLNYTLDNTGSSAKTIAFSNFTANRAMTVVIKVKGKVGNITWPGSVAWNNSIAPDLGTNTTMIVLYWDGTSFIGAQGATN